MIARHMRMTFWSVPGITFRDSRELRRYSFLWGGALCR